MTTHAFAVIVSVIGLAGCATSRADEPPAVRPVRVAAASIPEVTRGLRYAVTTQPSESVTVAIKANGYVGTVLQVRGADERPRTLQPGDVVRAGTVLVRVREAEYLERLHQAEGSLEEAMASRAKARLDLDRARALFEAESLTTPDRDAAQAAFDGAAARVTAVRAQVEAARLSLADCVLPAPIDGVVLERRIEAGMLAGAGTVAFVLGRVADIKAVFGVPDSVVSHLRTGQPLAMTTEAFPGATFQGRVTGVAPSADPQSRVFAVEVTLPNRDGRLRPGMIGAVEITPPASSTTSPAGVAIPLAAIVRASHSPDGYGVFVVDAVGGREVARARSVTLGPAVGNAVVVTEGVRVGERVVVMGATLIADGEPVRIIP